MNKATDPSAEHQQGGDTVDAERTGLHRRAILKGSVAALPVIVTLRSGAALAVTSANGCVQASQAQAAAESPPPPTIGNDFWLRTPIKYTSVKQYTKGTGSDPAKWVESGEIFVYQNTTTSGETSVWWGLKIAESTPQDQFTTSSARGITLEIESGGTVTGYEASKNSVTSDTVKYLFMGQVWNGETVLTGDGLVVTNEQGQTQYTDVATGTKQVGLIATSNGASAISESCWCSIT